MQTLGDRIREIREAKHWTQDDLAEAAGIHRVTIAKYEAGTVVPKSTSLQRLAAALEVDAGYLLGEVDELTERDKEIWEIREQVRREPERHYLFSMSTSRTMTGRNHSTESAHGAMRSTAAN